MAKFIIEQYELHAQKYEVEAENKVDAIKALFEGQANIVDSSLDYVQVAHDYFQPNLFSYEELNAIDKFSTIEDDCVTSIRSIEKV